MIKISPEPWKVIQEGNYVKVVDADGEVVSDLRLIHKGKSETIGWNNALMIEASPALARALLRILNLQEEHDGEPFENVVLHAEAIAKEALASIT